MHVPDGFLDGKTMAAAAALSAGGLGVAVWQARRLSPRRVPLLGVSAAFVFAAQMLNFPVAGGTSGHLIGGVLTAVLLGPGAAVLVMTAVLVVQCLLFADGGLLALGANVLNMAVVDSVGGYLVYRLVCRLVPGMRGMRGRVAAVAFAAWCGAVLASVVCAGELVASGTGAARVVLPAMAGVHMLIGVGEALITALVVKTVWSSRPELVDNDDRPRERLTAVVPGDSTHPAAARPGFGSFALYGLVIALALALFVSPFASSWPDGLDRVSQRLGFSERAASHRAPMPDYQLPGIGHAGAATAAAGAVGTLIAFGLALLLSRALVPNPGTAGAAATAEPAADGPEVGAPPPPATES